MLVTLLLIAIHYLRIHLVGGQRLVRIAPPSLPPHHCSPCNNLICPILVKEHFLRLLSRHSSPAPSVSTGSSTFVFPPSVSGGGSFMHAPLCWVISVIPLLAGISVFLQSDVHTQSRLSILRFGHSCRGYHIGLFNQRLTWSILSGDSVRILRLL